ncbi:MAG: YcaO-like family protein [Rhizobiaceae bacterium]
MGSGSHRISSVNETFDRVEPISGEFGITRLANVTGLDRIGIPVALAIRPNSKSVAVSQGKGETLQHAKTSALMEAIEIWHAENFDQPVHYGKKHDLQRRHRVIDTQRLPKLRGRAYSDNVPTLWVMGEEVISSDPILLPYEMVHCDYTRPIQPAHGYFPASTNGLASGNSILEALCHGLAEVVERDALSLWHFSHAEQRARKRINPVTIANEEIIALLKKVTDAGLECGFWNVTSDVEVATIICLIHEPDSQMGHIGLGSGTHTDSTVALRRALTEAAQTRLNYISGARDDLAADEFTLPGIVQKQDFVEATLSAGDPTLPFGEVPTNTFPTLREDLDYMVASLRQVGIEEIGMVNLSRQEFDIPVVRAIVPGLEAPHDDNSYVAGPRAQDIMRR